jgi:hypothetical protein
MIFERISPKERAASKEVETWMPLSKPDTVRSAAALPMA